MNRPRGHLVIIAAAVVLVLWALRVPFSASARSAEPPAGTETSVRAERDSLLMEIRSYANLMSSMRDSLALDEFGIQLDEAQKERIRESIGQVSKVVQNISQELGRLDLQIKNNRISLLNESGEGIVINIPENLDSHLSEGLNTISKLILSELPDSLHVDKNWTWSGLTHAPPKPRKVIAGNVVKVGSDVLVSADEDVRGDVVVVLGNAEIAGHVQGDVVVVLGDLQVGEHAEIEGHTVAVGGSLDQDPDAKIGEVTVVDPLPGSGLEMGNLIGSGWLSFFFSQGLFLMVLILAGLASVMTPRARFEAITGSLRSGPLPAMGIGVLAALVGNLILVFLGLILVLTVIGLPLALLLGLASGLVSILAVAVVGAVVGQSFCRLLGRACAPSLLSVLVGMCVLHLASFLGSLLAATLGSPVPLLILGSLGALVKILAYCLGLGALLRSRLGS